MDSIIHKLCWGQIAVDKQSQVDFPGYDKMGKEIQEETAFWRDRLSGDEMSRLDSLFSLITAHTTMEEDTRLITGFRLGALVMLEVLEGGL